MRERPQILDHLTDLLAPLGPVQGRFMFGGWGLYLEGVMFALIAGDELYLRSDEITRGDFETRGLGPFRPWPDKPMTMPYHPLPPEVLDDADEINAWARRAYEAALRARKAKKSGRKRRRR